MATWIERELKLLLPDADAFRRVEGAAAFGPVVRQENHFFDRADGALRRAKIGVRLREEAGARLLTIKGDALDSGRGALTRRIELERPIAAGDFERALAEGLDLAPWLDAIERESPPAERAPELHAWLRRIDLLCRGHRLARRAGFTNRRRIAPLALRDPLGLFSVELTLDETLFPGGRIDYELEVELAPDAEAPERVETALRAWLAAQGVAAPASASSKLARLEEQLARLGA